MADPDPVRNYTVGAGAAVDLKEMGAAKAQVDAMAASVLGMKQALQDFSQSSYRLADQINRHLKSIGAQAEATANSLNALSGATGSLGPGTSSANAAAATTTSGFSNKANNAAAWVSSASSSINNAVNKPRIGGLSLGTFLGNSDDTAKDLVMAPLRFLRDRINTNRDTAIMASGALNMQGMQQGVSTASIMSSLSKFPGSIYGSPQELVSLFGNAPALGASFNFASPGTAGGRGQGVRAAGFFKGIQEMQMMSPGAQVGGEGGLVSQLGGYSADTGAQQKAMMLTGGAMGMIGGGGRQKSLSEWAESILKWFEGLRSGPDRGKAFNYGQLMAQYFPGSNIDAWFNATGVPQNMRDYWWTYALAKAGHTGDEKFKIGADQNNVAWQRLRAGSELTRTEFGLAGSMSGQYANREGSNRWFNELMGQMMSTIIPALSKSILAPIQFLPDAIEDLLFTGTERGLSELMGGADGGDIGDVGDSYGAMGGNSTSGLHPDMKSKLGRMMKANPKLRVNSGLRDTGLQERLKASGHSRVSGKPSAHTRGMAADLGPRSQYGWIAKNAKRFGLASGKGHGEPWHVGMQGDIPGVGDVDIGDFSFSDFTDALKGGGSIEGMASIVTTLMGWMTKGIGAMTKGTGSDPTAGYNPDSLYAALAAKSLEQQNDIGKKASGSKDDSTSNGFVRNPSTLPGGGGAGSSEAGQAAATALFNAGFKKRSDLETITAISWRESKWDPSRKNPTTSDRGLMQINMSAHKGLMAQMGYTESDLMDIQKNANMAYRLWSDGGGNWASFQQLWGFSERSPYQNGGPGWDRNGDPLGRTQGANAPAVVEAADLPGLGDIGTMQASVNMPMRQGGGGVSFNNTFNLAVPTYGSGGSGGIDVRQTVTLLADHLEAEMSRRMKRSA